MKVLGQLGPDLSRGEGWSTHVGAQNDLEKIGQGHSAQNSSESFLTCIYILNMKVIGQLGLDLSRGEGWSTQVGHGMTLKK